MNSSCNYIKKLNDTNGKSKRSEKVARAFDRKKSNGLRENRKSGIRGNWAENDIVNHSFRNMDNSRKNNHPKFGKLIGTKLREKSKRVSKFDTNGIYIPKEVPGGQEKEKNGTRKWLDPTLRRDVSVGKSRTRKGSEKIRQSGDEVSQMPHVRPALKGNSIHFNGVDLCKKRSKGRHPPDENLDYQNHNHCYPSTGFTRKEAKANKNINDDFDRAEDKLKRRGRVTPTDPSDISNKRLDDDVLIADKPRKRRKVIRIDPYDISNKRLDDGILIPETEVKEEIVEKEMSKNALFRAIRPSPSIMSFVENNLLGRRRLIELKRSGYNTDISSPLDNIPHSKGPERETIEEPIFKNKLSFFAAAKISSSFPPPSIPEIAFAGRSNVGKSSLLNSLTRQWGVVRTSDKPGLTQTINFFQLGSKLCLVDLPGYGFAYAKEEIKEAWQELVKEYVSTRDGLKRVCLLIDTKWGMKIRDHELVDLMERSHTKYQIVLTKTDLVFPIDVARRAMQIQESLQANKSLIQPVMMASSKSGAGIRCLRTVLANIARFAKP